MPFTCIQGTFHLVGHDKNGKPTGFEPDGDSIHFKPKKIALLDGLTRLGVKYKPSAIGSVNLRMEGIDALEIHYTPSFKGAKRTHQPRPLADYERDALTGLLGMNPVPYKQPLGTTVAPPVSVDGVPGYILSRSLDVHGRPVSFLYKGAAPFTDGKQVMVNPAILKKSLNFAMIRDGNAYPLFYDTLFMQLRVELAKAAKAARTAKKGMWKQNVTKAGFKANGLPDLETARVIFPKLFRRLADYFESGRAGLAGFIAWQAAISQNDPKKDQVQEPNGNFTHFDNVLSFKAGKLSMKFEPEDLVFISEKM